MMIATPVPAPSVATDTFAEDTWEDLLNYIEERRVIPIVGPELLTVTTEAGPENLYTWPARTLAARLGIAAADLPAQPALNDVVVRFLAHRGPGPAALAEASRFMDSVPAEIKGLQTSRELVDWIAAAQKDAGG